MATLSPKQKIIYVGTKYSGMDYGTAIKKKQRQAILQMTTSENDKTRMLPKKSNFANNAFMAYVVQCSVSVKAY